MILKVIEEVGQRLNVNPETDKLLKGLASSEDKFIDKISECRYHDLKIAENFNDYSGDSVEEEIDFQDTSQLLLLL